MLAPEAPAAPGDVAQGAACTNTYTPGVLVQSLLLLLLQRASHEYHGTAAE